MILNSKKGLMDFITVGMLMFLVVITMWVVWTAFNAANEIPIFHENTVVDEIMDNGSGFISSFNIMFPLLLFSLNLYSIIALFFLDSHPIMFIVHMLLLPITIMIMIGIAGGYEATISETAFAVANPTINFIMLNLHKIMAVFDILGGIALFTVLKQKY